MRLATNIHAKDNILKVSEACINICNLRLRTYIGFNPEEKAKQQDVVINIQIRYSADLAFDSDDEEDALNYKTITKSMILHTEHGRFHLLEKLAADLLAIATESKRVSFAEIKVDKPHALRFADSVSVTLSATRD
ncbi:MAG: D-erythro-7,8-dihydroneopterin triphosphate epimerase [Polaribacter sp.]|jgi:D-erythro-7,8-dihydroneopterin triphosphate epimerase